MLALDYQPTPCPHCGTALRCARNSGGLLWQGPAGEVLPVVSGPLGISGCSGCGKWLPSQDQEGPRYVSSRVITGETYGWEVGDMAGPVEGRGEAAEPATLVLAEVA